jgi:hypothetical protein
MAEAEAGAATNPAGRRSKQRSKPRSGRSRKVGQRKERASEDPVQHMLQREHASRPQKRRVRRRELMQKALAQTKGVDKKMPRRKPPSRRGKKSCGYRARALMNETLA